MKNLKYLLPISSFLMLSLLSGCGDGREPSVPPSVNLNAAGVVEYTLLAEEFNSFYRAALATNPSARPKTVEDVKELVGYEFAEGVDLVEFNLEDSSMCFTGPKSTYMTQTMTSDVKRRTLGQGEDCDYEDGDIVLEDLATATGEPAEGVSGEQVVRGEELVEDIPALMEWSKIAGRSQYTPEDQG